MSKIDKSELEYLHLAIINSIWKVLPRSCCNHCDMKRADLIHGIGLMLKEYASKN